MTKTLTSVLNARDEKIIRLERQLEREHELIEELFLHIVCYADAKERVGDWKKCDVFHKSLDRWATTLDVSYSQEDKKRYSDILVRWGQDCK